MNNIMRIVESGICTGCNVCGFCKYIDFLIYGKGVWDSIMKESLKKFYKYNASNEELLMYIRINAGEWNEESFINMKKIVREVIKDYKYEECYPKVFVSYFVTNIPSVINILSNFKGCTEEEIRKGYTEETYLSMIAEKIKELKSLQLEFEHSLFEQYELWVQEIFD